MQEKRSRFGLCLWLCGWLVAAAFVVWHAGAVATYLDRVSGTTFTSSPVETPLRRVPQSIAPDGQVWVRHALSLAESGDWRLRSTDIDNAPDGRPIYWNSAWALWLEGCGRLRKAFTDEPLPLAIETASLWANLPVFFVVMALASGWVWRRWGGAAGALTAIGLAGHRGFYGGFYPAYCDHHGLIAASVLGLVLGVAMAGAGWRREKNEADGFLPRTEAEMMRAMTVSAICGAFGMWVSAASLVVTIAFTGTMAVTAGFALAKSAAGQGIVCVPNVWRRWGLVGAMASVVFYLMENAPDRLGLRLEANHPLYALSWWAAGEAIAAALEWRAGLEVAKKTAIRRLAGWGAVCLVAPVVVIWKGMAVFAPLDPFLGRIHESIHEFRPLIPDISRAGQAAYRDQLMMACWLALAAIVWLTASKRAAVGERLVVLFAAGVAALAMALALGQNRWLLTAGAPQVVLAVVLLACTAGWRRCVFLGGTLLLFAQGPWMLARERLHVERVRDVQMGETVQLLYRDIAAALLRHGADARSIVLSDPNASVGVGYYGRLRTVGTLYWENRDGLHAAAEILGAHDDAEAAARIHAQGITHLALVSTHDFQAEYNYALRGGSGPFTDEDSLGHRLLYRHRIPAWLRPLGYRVPAPLAPLGFRVELFAVDLETPRAAALERIGRYQLSKGERGLATESFRAATLADASRAEAWLRLGELALAEGRLFDAARLIKTGIDRTPLAERERLTRDAITLFERQGAEGKALAATLSAPTR